MEKSSTTPSKGACRSMTTEMTRSKPIIPVVLFLFLLLGVCHGFLGTATSRSRGQQLFLFNEKTRTTTSSSTHLSLFRERTASPLSSLLSTAESGDGDAVQQDEKKKKDAGSFDYYAVFKYTAALVTQMTLLFGVFTGLDKIVGTFNIQIPFFANFILFYFLALKSRIFNPLSNNRPQPQTKEIAGEEQKRVMPTWTPPGFIFPIVWLLVIAPIRATASAMIYGSTMSYTTPAIMALMLHLSIGDVWNTINNVEKRYGVSVVGVVLVWLSKAFAAYQYYLVVPMAGKLLALPLIWLTIASSLIIRTWQLNPEPETGKPEPLYPVVGKKTTKFAWFSSTDE